jgi:hypothetical protein
VANVPTFFCWSKFGDEAGESVPGILARKEAERDNNDGVFLWGIGSSIAPSLRELLRHEPNPKVLFTPMLSPPAQRDVKPRAVAVWHSAKTMEGLNYLVPQHSLVTSRAEPERTPRRHYALVCRSDRPITRDEVAPWFDDADVRNLRTGALVGASQVTSVVRLMDEGRRGHKRYRVAFTAELDPPYFVTLSNCTVLTESVEPHASTA